MFIIVFMVIAYCLLGGVMSEALSLILCNDLFLVLLLVCVLVAQFCPTLCNSMDPIACQALLVAPIIKYVRKHKRYPVQSSNFINKGPTLNCAWFIIKNTIEKKLYLTVIISYVTMAWAD